MPPRISKAQTQAKAQIEAYLKDGQLVYGNNEQLAVQYIPFGLGELDGIIGGGVPRKRISVLVGEESAGKSFLLQTLIKKALEDGLSVGYIDTEFAFDPAWWRQVGVDTEKLLVAQPTTGEKAVDIAQVLAQAKLDIVAIDSIAGLIPMKEVEDSAEDSHVATQARLVATMLRKLLSVNQNSAIVCTNQLRDSIGGHTPIANMPGGRALRHFNSLLLRVRRGDWIEEQGRRTGFNIQVLVAKNKVGKPWDECLLPFLFRGKIDMLSLLIDRALEAGEIQQTGSWYNVLNHPERIQGRNNVIVLLRESDDLRQRLELALGDYREAESA